MLERIRLEQRLNLLDQDYRKLLTSQGKSSAGAQEVESQYQSCHHTFLHVTTAIKMCIALFKLELQSRFASHMKPHERTTDTVEVFDDWGVYVYMMRRTRVGIFD
jgi:uncharacterized damage-inducible protein DinB